MPFFGANCIHTPALESQPEATCPRCGGIHVAPNGRVIPNLGDADPVKVYELHVAESGKMLPHRLEMICGWCGRSRYDESQAMRRAVKPDDGKINTGYENLEGADTDRTDRTDRTADAVAGADRNRPLTRREKRQALYGKAT